MEKLMVMLAMVVFALSVCQADIYFSDGAIHDIDYLCSDNVRVKETGTLVNLLSGGVVDGFLHTTSTVIVKGGTVMGSFIEGSWDDSLSIIQYGAIAGDVFVCDEGQLAIFGGNIGGNLLAMDAGRLTIYGYDFNYEYGSIPFENGTLTGILSNGDAINLDFTVSGFGDIILVHEVPEPATVSLLALGGLALLRRRKYT